MTDAKLVEAVNDAIEDLLAHDGDKKIIIFPYGEAGKLTKRQLNECYGVKEAFIADSRYAKFNPEIKSLDYLKTLDMSQYAVLFAYQNHKTNLREILETSTGGGTHIRCFSRRERAYGARTHLRRGQIQT